MKYFSTFTGVGGFELGLPEDWECVGMSEVDKNANKVLRYRFPEVRNYGDIEKIEWQDVPSFDILVGGSPCQDVSMAGKREGLSGSRSRLFFEYVRALKAKKPQYFIFENVRGLLSSNQGWDFAEVINQFSKAGYDIWWQVLDAKDFGIPQHRERVFILGTSGGKGFREVFFESKNRDENNGLSGHTANTIRREYRRNSSNGSYIIEGKLNEKIETLHNSTKQADRIYGTGGIAPTLHRKTGGQQITKILTVSPNYKTQQQNRIYNVGGISPALLGPNAHHKVKIATLVRDLDGGFDTAHGRRFKTDGEESFTILSSKAPGLYDGARIRYLTPLECERLMGWPDDWTRYGIAENGKVIEMSDNARYNLIGNGVVPQVVSSLIRLLDYDGKVQTDGEDDVK